MKKFTLENYIKRAKILWKKFVEKVSTIKAKLLAGAATKKPPLSSLLATIGVNADNVINTFNEQTKSLTKEEILLPVTIQVDAKKNFKMNWDLPSTYDLYKKTVAQKIERKREELVSQRLVVFAYKRGIMKVKYANINKIKQEMKQTYGAIKSWDIYQEADHGKDKKRFKKKK